MLQRYPLPKCKVHDWLVHRGYNVTSQGGEDGILHQIFEILPPLYSRWCVEFGAWDGKHLSNTWNLLHNQETTHWSGVLIEADDEKFEALKKNYDGNDHIKCLQRMVDISGQHALDRVLIDSGVSIPKDFDFLCIDVDGADYHIWKHFDHFDPKLVVIEFNRTCL